MINTTLERSIELPTPHQRVGGYAVRNYNPCRFRAYRLYYKLRSAEIHLFILENIDTNSNFFTLLYGFVSTPFCDHFILIFGQKVSNQTPNGLEIYIITQIKSNIFLLLFIFTYIAILEQNRRVK